MSIIRDEKQVIAETLGGHEKKKYKIDIHMYMTSSFNIELERLVHHFEFM